MLSNKTTDDVGPQDTQKLQEAFKEISENKTHHEEMRKVEQMIRNVSEQMYNSFNQAGLGGIMDAKSIQQVVTDQIMGKNEEKKFVMPENENICGVCNEPSKSSCSKCKSRSLTYFYCGRDHQVADWPAHKAVCKVAAAKLSANTDKYNAIVERQTKDWPAQLTYIKSRCAGCLCAFGDQAVSITCKCDVFKYCSELCLKRDGEWHSRECSLLQGHEPLSILAGHHTALLRSRPHAAASAVLPLSFMALTQIKHLAQDPEDADNDIERFEQLNLHTVPLDWFCDLAKFVQEFTANHERPDPILYSLHLLRGSTKHNLFITQTWLPVKNRVTYKVHQAYPGVSLETWLDETQPVPHVDPALRGELSLQGLTKHFLQPLQSLSNTSSLNQAWQQLFGSVPAEEKEETTDEVFVHYRMLRMCGPRTLLDCALLPTRQAWLLYDMYHAGGDESDD